MTVAYLRISTGKQHLRNQQEDIQRFAALHNLTVDRWLTEVVSGRKSGRERKLGALLRRMKRGDTLIVTELSRLSRTLTEIMTIMGHCLERGIVLYSTKDGYAFDNSINSKVLCFAFGLVVEIERNLISMRTREALAVRRADGVRHGRARRGQSQRDRGDAARRLHVDGSVPAIRRLFENLPPSTPVGSGNRRIVPEPGVIPSCIQPEKAARRIPGCLSSVRPSA